MSNRRKIRHPPVEPPAHIVDTARRQRCPDCDSDIDITLDAAGIWHVAIRHDDECVQLAWRQRHAATTSVAVAATNPDTPVDPATVREVIDTLTTPGRGVRVAFDPEHSGLSWQERQTIDDTETNEP